MDFSSGYTLVANLFTHWPTDWILIGAFAVFAALDAMRTGPARATALVLSLPASLLVMGQFPEAFLLGPVFAQFTAPVAQAAIFGAISVFLYIATYRLIFTFSNGTGPIQSLIVGLAAAAVLLIVWLQVPGLDALWHFGSQVQTVFGEAYRFWWLVGSYVVLAAVRN